MNITYLILAHRYPEQLFRLVERLNDEGVNFLIHIDKKVKDPEYQYVLNKLAPLKNVTFIKRYTCYWGGYGIVQATFQGIREALEGNIPFDYLCLMSGQDYPIKTNHYIREYFKKHKGKSFINTRSFPVSLWHYHNGGYDRIQNWYFINARNQYGFPNKLFNKLPRLSKFISRTIGRCVPERKWPSRYKPFGGAQFWALDKKHVSYIGDHIHQNPAYFKFFKHVLVPDEILFQTIMGNYSHSKEEIINDTLHFLEWRRPGAVLTRVDQDNIIQTSHLFARKFDENVDPTVLDWIDREILNLNN
ncbi:beta-1,6-N-acetylglucosaminyltransferase [Anditalea andensis]|uniref:Peptide O-xylosyltransferase n=1 Tax=Anditalea andensis TaxID=1048983 RepID=A0A074KYF7_9BACT|nr:beta-1,6-N-acetylglucosaminyltransferase [Anditalea andensis]KEO72598.1 hypothetical protein EL17_17830 [Anditalea andensis]